ncbi:hypothetical protein GY45DRAFT_836671 [Cubamyces sp. BRFM 1775]|nr:hypothetical protein GY45DRAFT_836671 [Cubamyces sp. BRFM 1775]
MFWVQLDVEEMLTGEYAEALGMPPDEPPDDQSVAFDAELEGTEEAMYQGLCKGLNEALQLAGCSDLAAYFSDNHPQLSSKRYEDDILLRPEIAMYPTHGRAKSAYTLPIALLETSALKRAEDSEGHASQPSVAGPTNESLDEEVDDGGADVPTEAEILKAQIAWAWMELPIQVKRHANEAAFASVATDDFLPPREAQRRARTQLTEYARECFNHQPRCHLYSLAVDRHLARIIYTDRAGSIVSTPFDYTTSRTLWRFIYKFVKMTAAARGHDPSAPLATEDEEVLFKSLRNSGFQCTDAVRTHLQIATTMGCPVHALNIYAPWSRPGEPLVTLPRTGSTDPSPTTMLTSHRCLIGQPSVKCKSIDGRATQCFIAYDLNEGTFVWIKESWRTSGANMSSEFDIYQDIYKVLRDAGEAGTTARRHFLTVRAGGDVIWPPREADELHDPSLQCRIQKTYTHVFPELRAGGRFVERTPLHHYRLVFKEVCRILPDFHDGYELAYTMRGALLAHKAAWEQAGVLHTDVSVGNILIYDPPDTDERPYGILSGWDLAKTKEMLLERRGAQPLYPGTWQFMSVRRMCFPNTLHELSDDLESFILALRWCIYKFFKHSDSQAPHLATGTFFRYFDECDAGARSVCGLRFRDAVGDTPSGVPAAVLPGETRNLLNFLLARFRRLCCEHYNSPEVLPLWEREGLLADDDENFFGDTLKPPRRVPRSRLWCPIELPVARSRLTDYAEIMRAFEMVVARPPKLWHEETRKKLPDQVPEDLLRALYYPRRCVQHHHY